MLGIFDMFYQNTDIFQSSTARYAPLSSVESGDGSPHSDRVTLQHPDSTEKAHGKESISIRGKRRRLARFCLFGVGLVVGGALGLLGSTYIQHLGGDEWTLSSADIKQFAPQVPTTTVVFSKKTPLMDPPNDTNQRYWDALTPRGHGFVNVSDPEAYGLLPGIPTDSGVDRYSVAMFHQLHCLGLLRHKYWRLIDGMSENWTNAMRQEEVRNQLRDGHTQHCFAYITESVMCAGDLTIEWAKVERDGNRTQVDGWGVPHQCKDPEAIRAWMEANHGPAKDSQVHLHG